MNNTSGNLTDPEYLEFLYRNGSCTLDLCPVELATIFYRPSIVANSLILAIFALSSFAFIAEGIWWKTWKFMVCMVLGNLIEIAGYVGRIWQYYDPFESLGFTLQLTFLTIAPVFYSAAIYYSLSGLVNAFGERHSRLKPIRYTQIFITADVISLILQAAGGAMAATADDGAAGQSQSDTGRYLMFGGLTFQCVTMSLFVFLSAEYAFRVRKAASIGKQPIAYRTLLPSIRFRMYISALATATILVLIRSVYRAAEMYQGFDGELIHEQASFIVLEGVALVLAVLVLNVGHPGLGMERAKGIELRQDDDESVQSTIEMMGTNYDAPRAAHA